MNAIDLLKADHERVKGILAQLSEVYSGQKTTGQNDARRIGRRNELGAEMETLKARYKKELGAPNLAA